MTEDELKSYAELAKRITEAVHIIENKSKYPYITYKGASNFCLLTLLSYRDGIITMLKEAGVGSELVDENGMPIMKEFITETTEETNNEVTVENQD